MKIVNYGIKNSFVVFSLPGGRLCRRGTGVVHRAPFLAGMAPAVVLGLVVALSTPAFGDSGHAPVPNIINIADSAAKPEDGTGTRIGDKIDDKTGTPDDDATGEYGRAGAFVEFATSTSKAQEGDTLKLQIRVVGDKVLTERVTAGLSTLFGSRPGVDVSLPDSLVFEPGETSKDLELFVIDDAQPEHTESVVLTLGGRLPEGVRFGARTHTVTIIDNDGIEGGAAGVEAGGINNIIFVSPHSTSISEDGGNSNIDVIIGRPIPAGSAATVTVTPGGSAMGGTDYELSVAGGSLNDNMWTLPTETERASLTVTAVQDSVAEGENESLTLGFASDTLPDGWIVVPRTFYIEIIDDDEAVEATVGFATSASEVLEGGELPLRVELSNPLPHPITLTLYERSDSHWWFNYPRSLTFAEGETSKVVNFIAEYDGVFEDGKTMTLALRGHLPHGVKFGTRTHAVTIIEPASVVGFTKFSSKIKEGAEIFLGVEFSHPLPQPVTLSLAATGASEDIFAPDSLTFPAGETSAVFGVVAIDDAVSEDVEEVTLSLEGDLPDGVGIFGIQSHTITILDDGDIENGQITEVDGEIGGPGDETGENGDGVLVGFATSTSEVKEGDGRFPLHIRLSKPLSRPLTLGLVWSYTGRHAVAGEREWEWSSTGAHSDIVKLTDSSTSLVTFAPGETSKALEVAVVDDEQAEGTETFTYTLEGRLPDGVAFGTRVHTITITDDDDAEDGQIPEFSGHVVKARIGFATAASEVKEGDVLSLRIRLSKPLPQPVTVSMTKSRGGTVRVRNLSDSVTFLPGETSKRVELAVLDDLERNRGNTVVTYTLKGMLPDGVSFGRRAHRITVLHDDRDDSHIGDSVEATVGFTESASEMKEGESLSLHIRLSEPLPVDLVLFVFTPVNDDVVHDSYVVLMKGETSAVLEITAVDDEQSEGAETIAYTLGGVGSGVYFRSIDTTVRYDTRIHTVTIIDNDDPEEGRVAEIENPATEAEGHAGITVPVSEYGTAGMTIVADETTIETFPALRRTGERDADERRRHARITDETAAGAVAPGTADGGSDGVHVSFVKNAIQGIVGWVVRAWHQGAGDGDAGITDHGDIDWGESAGHDGDGGIGIINHGDVDSDMDADVIDPDEVPDYHVDGDTEIAGHGVVDLNMHASYQDDGDIGITTRGIVGLDAPAAHWDDGDIEIANHGVVDSDMDVDHGGDGDFPDVLTVNYETVGSRIYDNYFMSDGENVYFEGDIAGGFQNELRGKAIRLGNVDFKGSKKGEDADELIIYGDYEGTSDTQLNFHVGPNKDFGKLQIYGDVTGQSRVSLVADDANFITESTDFPEMILVGAGHAVEADSFAGEQTVGAFNYVLEYALEGLHKNHAWGFVNRGLSDAAERISQIADELSDGMEDSPAANPGERTELGLWGERDGSRATIGLDAFATRLMGGDMLAGTSVSQNFSTSNDIDVESYITALTANWERKGFYAGGQARYARFTSDVSTDRLSVVQGNEGTGVNASVDLGYRFALPFGGVDFQVAPQAQLVWSRVNFDDFVGPHGELVSLEDGDRVTGRLGLSWDGEWQGAEGFGRFYGGMNLRVALDGETSVNISGVSIASERKDLSVDGKLGLSYEWDEGYAVHGEVLALRDGDAGEIRANVGLRIDF
ncbi:MAG: autotransporter outer membrane beta-barrel domain-containing protein [Hyphomicrobiales bacterium]|nr:autotransporter outer membrane beta-barrel domain-containing protein [Hyphomicrobiales bacterium]